MEILKTLANDYRHTIMTIFKLIGELLNFAVFSPTHCQNFIQMEFQMDNEKVSREDFQHFSRKQSNMKKIHRKFEKNW